MEQWQHGSAQTIANNSQNYSAAQWQHGPAEMVANNYQNNSVEQRQHFPAQLVGNNLQNHLVQHWYITIHRPTSISLLKSMYNVISNNFNALRVQDAILTTLENWITMNEFEAESSNVNAYTTIDAKSIRPPKKIKYSEAVALTIPDANNPHRRKLTVVRRIPGDAQSRSIIIIHLFEGNIFPSRYRKMKFPTFMVIGDFMACIGGTARCRIQELKQAPKPTAPIQPGEFFARATYMYGTQKTIEAAGWLKRRHLVGDILGSFSERPYHLIRSVWRRVSNCDAFHISGRSDAENGEVFSLSAFLYS
ncbi:hypothetical protein RUND412_003792 [Rhizina undulata]